MALTISAAAAQAMAVALATDIGSAATIEIRTGTKPATPETAASGTLLATVAISGSFTASGGSLTAANPAAVTVAASGTAAHYRVKTSGGTAKIDGTVGTSGADMNLDNVALVSGGSVDLGVPTITVPVA
jgi:hypothetical protein